MTDLRPRRRKMNSIANRRERKPYPRKTWAEGSDSYTVRMQKGEVGMSGVSEAKGLVFEGDLL